MATVSEIAAKNNAKRAKMRSSRQSIDSIKMGAEPFFEDGESAKLGESEARSTWSKAAQWYNYFYKLKEFMPYIYQYAEEEMKLDKDQMKALKAVVQLPVFIIVVGFILQNNMQRLKSILLI